MANISALFVAVPEENDPINALSSEDQAHVTLIYFGDATALPEDLTDELLLAGEEVAQRFGPFDAKVAGTATIGPDKANVLLLESKELVSLRNYLLEIPSVMEAQAMAEQFPWWIPHTTCNYDGPVPENPPESVRIGALGFWYAGEKESYKLAELKTDLTAAALCIPEIRCTADISLGIRYASTVPSARWYVTKRARALGMTDKIPESWSRV